MSVSSASTIQHVLFLIAMEAEAAPLLAHLQLEEIKIASGPAPSRIYSGSYKGLTVSVATNGKDATHNVDNVGTNAAVLTTFIAIQQLKPDLIINAGTAGGFQRNNAAIGDPFISESFYFHDRRIPIPGYDAYGKGGYSSLSVITDIVDGSRPTNEEFLENLHVAAASLQVILPKILDFIVGKTISEL